MATQQKTPEFVFRSFTALPVTLGLIFFAPCQEPLNLVIAEVRHFLCGLAGQLLAALPSLALAPALTPKLAPSLDLFQNIFAAGHSQLFTGAQLVLDTCQLLHLLLRVA